MTLPPPPPEPPEMPPGGGYGNVPPFGSDPAGGIPPGGSEPPGGYPPRGNEPPPGGQPPPYPPPQYPPPPVQPAGGTYGGTTAASGGQDRTQLFGILGIVLGICLCGPAGLILGYLSVREAAKAGKPKTLGYIAIGVGALGIILQIVEYSVLSN